VTPDDFVTVGRVVRPHGNRGEVVVASETDFGERRFRAGSALRVRGRDLALTVLSSREYDGRWIVWFEGITSIDAAESLRGAELTIESHELGALARGGYYVHDLVGCRVEIPAGKTVGQVRDVQFGTGVPLLVVDGQKAEVLVPFTEAICRRVDLVAGVIVIEPPDGLLELNETGRN
jgi:16S rRNA processing protein RimM